MTKPTLPATLSRYLWVACLCVLGVRGTWAQNAPAPLNPVKWTLEVAASEHVRQPGETFDVRIVAELEQGWHLYATKEIPLGPRPTRFALTPNQPFELWGDIKTPQAKTAFDANFNTELEFYEHKAVFTLPLRIAAQAASRKHLLTVQARYQTCTEKQCSPPKLVKLEAEVEINGNP